MTVEYTVEDLKRALTQGINEDHDQIRITIGRDDMKVIMADLEKAALFDLIMDHVGNMSHGYSLDGEYLDMSVHIGKRFTQMIPTLERAFLMVSR